MGAFRGTCNCCAASERWLNGPSATGLCPECATMTPHERARRSKRTVVRMIVAAAAFAAALGMLVHQAHADDLVPDAGVALADAGAPLDVPVELQAGQPAPFHGYELSDARAQTLLLNQQTAEPAPAVNGAVVVLLAGTGFVVGVLLGAYLEAKAAK